ncbi:MAG: hypothetical protein O3B01_18055 [Planctomycetota bacterium]|nr:hypothetical protein [Planctomycetota bacterium]MDA1140478.1 hypothetical protein [Planctomycetota bacterium]
MDEQLEMNPTEDKRTDARIQLLLYAGLATTALTLLAMYFLNNKGGINVMGWYAWFVVPIGALLVGSAAGSGYAIAAKSLGVKLNKILLISIFCLQVGAYGVAQYIEYSSQNPTSQNGQSVGFWTYFDYQTRSFTFSYRGKQGNPLGLLGYGIRVLEITGFALGTIFLASIVAGSPYCDGCKKYMERRRIGLFPAGLALSKKEQKLLEKPEGEELRQSLEEAGKGGIEGLNKLIKHIEEGDYEAFAAGLETGRSDVKATEKLSMRLSIMLVQCDECLDGYLKMDAIRGQGEHIVNEPIVELPLPVSFRERIREDFPKV